MLMAQAFRVAEYASMFEAASKKSFGASSQRPLEHAYATHMHDERELVVVLKVPMMRDVSHPSRANKRLITPSPNIGL